MKKIKLFLVALCVILATFTINTKTTYAASVSASGNASVAQDSTVTIIINVSGATVTSGSIEITTSSSLQVVSGAFKLANTTLAKFDTSNNKGAFAFSGAKGLSGAYFAVTVKGKSIDANAWVKATVTLKNGANDVSGGSTTMKIKVICKNHSYGEFTTVNPTCTSAGSKTRTCSVCGTVDKQTIPATGHDLSSLTVTKQPTCTETGLAEGTCSKCHNTVKTTVPAAGHDWGSWNSTKEATCVEHGEELRKCKACGVSQTRETEFATHKLTGEITVLQEATLTSAGVEEGMCEVCGQTVRTESQCKHVDESTGVEIDCKQGAFPEGTEIKIVELETTSEQYRQAIEILSPMGLRFKVYDFSAILSETTIQPNGTLTVVLDLPEGYSSKSAFVYISNEGEVEVMKSSIKDNKITANIEHFSTYAIIDMESGNGGSSIWLYTTIGFGITTILFLALYLTKKPKEISSK